MRMAAFTDAAGKVKPGAPLNGNEDSCYVSADLSAPAPAGCVPDAIFELGSLGCLMCVADGMGGLNAGEVASQIAVQTVAEYFAPGRLTPVTAGSPQQRAQYLEQTVMAADARISAESEANSSHRGMGSTIILAWIVNNQLTVTWCGDSRAYLFNPASGIKPLSCDHSMVQEWVNKGIITYDETFQHPQGNIVTHCLGQKNSMCTPETRQFRINDGDIVLLCSDGLSGVLRDRRTPDGNGGFFPGDTIEDLLRNNGDSMEKAINALRNAAEQAQWYDNVTILLCQVISGAGSAVNTPETAHIPDAAASKPVETIRMPRIKRIGGSALRTGLMAAALVLTLTLLILGAAKLINKMRQSDSGDVTPAAQENTQTPAVQAPYEEVVVIEEPSDIDAIDETTPADAHKQEDPKQQETEQHGDAEPDAEQPKTEQPEEELQTGDSDGTGTEISDN